MALTKVHIPLTTTALVVTSRGPSDVEVAASQTDVWFALDPAGKMEKNGSRMTPHAPTPTPAAPTGLRAALQPRFLTAFSMGVASGLPLLVTITLMQAWAKDAGVRIEEIGLLSLVGLPYTLKFLWAPLFDRITLPFLGRRRGWLLVCQLALMAAIVLMGLCRPERGGVFLVLFVLAAFAITFASASQDIVIDAFRREDLRDNELGLGSSCYIYGYRVGMLLVSGGGMILAEYVPWPAVFAAVAACLLPGLLTTLLVAEPRVDAPPPQSLRESVIEPFADYFRQADAWLILLFILLYKLGDNMAAALATPFYMDIGFSKAEIGAVVKLAGFWATLAGSFIGGLAMLRLGIHKSLWVFGLLQMVSTAGFALLARLGHSLSVLAGVVSFENLSAGMGTAAFVAFMAALTNKRFTATQYALLTSLMGVPRVVVSAVTGYLAAAFGWFGFFLFCTIIALPGLALLLRFSRWQETAGRANA